MRRALVGVGIGLVLLAGCGDGGDDPQTAPSDSGTPTATSSEEPTATSSSEPTATEPTVEPATGVVINLDRIKMRAPDGWRKNDPLSTFLIQAHDPKSFSIMSLSDLSAVGDASLREQARIAADRGSSRTKIREPVEIAGVRWYHVTGRDDPYTTLDQFGTIHNGSEAVVDFLLDDEIPQAEQQEIIESALATVEWK